MSSKTALNSATNCRRKGDKLLPFPATMVAVWTGLNVVCHTDQGFTKERWGADQGESHTRKS